MSSQDDPRPSFHETRKKHHILLGWLLEDLLTMGVAEPLEISLDSLLLLDQLGVGRPEVIDAALASLSRLSGEEYNHANVGQFGFLPSASPVRRSET